MTQETKMNLKAHDYLTKSEIKEGKFDYRLATEISEGNFSASMIDNANNLAYINMAIEHNHLNIVKMLLYKPIKRESRNYVFGHTDQANDYDTYMILFRTAIYYNRTDIIKYLHTLIQLPQSYNLALSVNTHPAIQGEFT